MAFKKVPEHGQVLTLFPMSHRVPQAGLYDTYLIVHEIQVQETSLVHVCKLIQLCEIPVL